jgi:hypothetical protein
MERGDICKDGWNLAMTVIPKEHRNIKATVEAHIYITSSLTNIEKQGLFFYSHFYYIILFSVGNGRIRLCAV